MDENNPVTAGTETPLGTPAPQTNTNQQGSKEQIHGYVNQLEAWLDDVMVKKAPFHIPMGGKEFLVTIAPYFVILGAVLFLFSIPALLGLGMLGGGMGMMTGYSGWGYTVLISTISGVVSLVIELMALSGLFKRAARSWRLMYYASLVSIAGSLLSLNIVGAVIAAVIGWYILFQVKELYKN
ncbi:MAG: hypothetical protein E6P95_02470 [Candidatus Moraniibacteriota bacterium]|nr:MAG: hypothetical protein E6P95_02470 [Candidatus Moranbacteria bacterium]